MRCAGGDNHLYAANLHVGELDRNRRVAETQLCNMAKEMTVTLYNAQQWELRLKKVTVTRCSLYLTICLLLCVIEARVVIQVRDDSLHIDARFGNGQLLDKERIIRPGGFAPRI